MARKRAHGEGTIFFSDAQNRWVAEISTLEGKRKRKYARTQREAREWLQAQKQALKEGTIVVDEKVTLAEFIDRYIEDVASHTLRASTLTSYKSLIKHHIKPSLGHIRVSALSPAVVQKFYAEKLNSGLSKRTVQYIHSVLHKALNYAVRWELAPRNVTDLVDKPSPKRKPVEPLTVAQVQIFLETARPHRWYPIYVTALYCGLREGEVLGIHVEDLDLEKGVLHVNNAVQYIIGQGLVVVEPKSDSSRQPVTIPGFALQVLRQHVRSLNKKKGLIFTTQSGYPISARNLVRHFKSVLEKAGLPNVRFHDLRHTTASLLIAAGCHPKEIQQVMRHSQWNLTMDTYGHLMPGATNDAARKLNDLLGGGETEEESGEEE